MCSLFDGLIHQNLQLDIRRSNLMTTSEDLSEWCEAFTFIARLIAYLTVLALLIFVIVTILKYLAESDDDQATTEHFELPPPPTTETTPLCCSKWVPATYRTCGEGEDDDIETGSCSSSSSEELYDGKICVICYDEERNCFFVPCGHCATCYSCGERIFEGDSRTCPVCRRPIRKVRKWFTS
ncbi:E3 ubiquitin-protein ligase APD2-like [Punica granatum]|nr:E3 ubiquitin-protein ligase APD2-like [Punica granatum]XP_031395672.1 E3 ubiquitin-protein ligase APD2-like [Punica granatum]